MGVLLTTLLSIHLPAYVFSFLITISVSLSLSLYRERKIQEQIGLQWSCFWIKCWRQKRWRLTSNCYIYLSVSTVFVSLYFWCMYNRLSAVSSWHILMRMKTPKEGGSCDPVAPLELPHSLHAFHRVSPTDELNKVINLPPAIII